jgi:hypothetical protein
MFLQGRVFDHPDFIASVGEQLSSVQARAAALGLVVRPLRSDHTSTAFVVARTTASREFAELQGVIRFLDQYSGGWDGR